MVQAMVAEMKSKQAKAVEEAVVQKHKVVLAGWLAVVPSHMMHCSILSTAAAWCGVGGGEQ